VPPEGDIGAVVLAAGASRRFGEENKLLATIDGRSLLERVIEALAGGGVAQTVVVTGWDREAVEGVVAKRDVHLAHNAAWEAGMGGSIGVGIAASGPAIAGALVVPGDMPLLTTGVVAALLAAFEQCGRDRVVYPVTTSGAQRNPVLWPRRFFADLQALPPAAGAKALLAQLPASDRVALPVDDEGAFFDIDTPTDLAAVRGRG